MPFWSRRSLEFSPTLISFPAFPPESAPYLRGSCRCLFYLVCSLPGKLNPTQGLANHPMLSTTHRYPPPAPLQGPHVATTAHFRLDILAGTSHHLAPCKCRLPKGTFLLQQTAPACTVILSGSWEPTLILPSFLQAISLSQIPPFSFPALLVPTVPTCSMPLSQRGVPQPVCGLTFHFLQPTLHTSARGLHGESYPVAAPGTQNLPGAAMCHCDQAQHLYQQDWTLE